MDRHRALEIALEFFPEATQRELLDTLFEHTRYPAYGDADPEVGLREDLTFFTNRLKQAADA